ncbi:MAG: hypothetical protein H6720_27005 [Sandaracinus sp.]|nr:hypothetical protein [Sandaracinus sp.]
MLQGAIIGAVVGIIMVFVQMARMRRGADKVMGALQQGGEGARPALDAWVKPVVAGQKVSANKLVDTLERFSWLALLGDFDALEEEGGNSDGMLGVRTQCQAHALAALIAHRDLPRDVENLERVTETIEREGGALMGLVKKNTRDLLAMAHAKAGRGLDTASRDRVVSRARQSSPASKVVLLRLATVATRAAGQDASALEAEANTANVRLARP